jgi:hypothetical protein
MSQNVDDPYHKFPDYLNIHYFPIRDLGPMGLLLDILYSVLCTVLEAFVHRHDSNTSTLVNDVILTVSGTDNCVPEIAV